MMPMLLWVMNCKCAGVGACGVIGGRAIPQKSLSATSTQLQLPKIKDTTCVGIVILNNATWAADFGGIWRERKIIWFQEHDRSEYRT